jgi:hypothetical protein
MRGLRPYTGEGHSCIQRYPSANGPNATTNGAFAPTRATNGRVGAPGVDARYRPVP